MPKKIDSMLQHADTLFERIGWMWLWFALSILLLLAVSPFNPYLIQSYGWALCKICMGAAAGYGFDWAAFRHVDPGAMPQGIERTMAQSRRATIIAAAVIAVALIG